MHGVFQLIPAISRSENKGTRAVGGFIGWINAGDWLKFERVDLGPPDKQPVYFTATVACPARYAGNTIDIRADALTGPLIGQLKVVATGGFTDWQTQSTPLHDTSGIHDLYLVFSGGGWNFDQFKITLPSRPGIARLEAVSFNDARGVHTRNGVICDTANGHWVEYAGLDFDNGADEAALSFASGNARIEDDQIVLHRDSPTGPVLGQLNVRFTGGWGSFKTQVVPITRIAGRHDIFLTFTGHSPSIADLASLTFIDQARNSATIPARSQ